MVVDLHPSIRVSVFVVITALQLSRLSYVSFSDETDILAIPAAMIVLNPEQLSLQEMEQMNEVFKYDSETIIVFTCNITPRFAGVLGSDNDSIFNENMKYLVVTDLKRIDIDM